MNWVLVIMIIGSHGAGTATQTIPFETEELCTQAAGVAYYQCNSQVSCNAYCIQVNNSAVVEEE